MEDQSSVEQDSIYVYKVNNVEAVEYHISSSVKIEFEKLCGELIKAMSNFKEIDSIQTTV